MTRILVTRHGHVDGIVPERFRGRADIPLTELGEAQARAVAERIAREWTPAAIYSSPLKRSVATANAIATACGRTVITLPALVDLDYGDLQWKTYDEVKLALPELFHAWFATPERVRFPNGESLQDLVARAADVIRLARERHAQDTVVLVGHDSVNRTLLMQLLDQPLSAYWRIAQSPCALNEIVLDGTRIRVQRVNDTSHLPK